MEIISVVLDGALAQLRAVCDVAHAAGLTTLETMRLATADDLYAFSQELTKLGGYVGLATAAAAWYASFAAVTNSTFGRIAHCRGERGMMHRPPRGEDIG